jgi:CheY-like chemotaxis protein
VQVESVPGEGTTISLLLPRSVRAPAPGREPARAAARTSRKRRVLLVEDDARVAEMVCAMLEQLGYECSRAADGASGLEAARQLADLDVVLTDMVMPGEMSGLDLAHRLKAERGGLPVILTTGYSASAAQAAAEGLPMLIKPYTLDALGAALEAALGASRPA